MTVTSAKGFVASGIAAGLKASGKPDVALVVNNGPKYAAAGVFTSNRIKAAPVLWSQQVLQVKRTESRCLQFRGANACTGPDGFADTHKTAEWVAALLGCGAGEVAVCSTGLIGERLPMDLLLPGFEIAFANLSDHGGMEAAQAIMTTDTQSKTATVTADGFTVGAWRRVPGCLRLAWQRCCARSPLTRMLTHRPCSMCWR